MITLICRATEHCPTELKGGRQVEGRLCGHSQAVLVQLRSTSATPVQCKAGSDLQIPLFSLRRKESLFKKKCSLRDGHILWNGECDHKQVISPSQGALSAAGALASVQSLTEHTESQVGRSAKAQLWPWLRIYQ